MKLIIIDYRCEMLELCDINFHATGSKPSKDVKLVGQDAHMQPSGNKTSITVVACASASGDLLQPRVILRVKEAWTF